MTKTVEFIFDFGSPNAYLAYTVLQDIAARTGAQVVLTPCLLGGLFKITGNQAPMTAFGESEPVATVGGQTRYTLELSRLYATDEAIGDGVSFYELDDFSVVVCRPGKRIIYSHCRWSNIEELGTEEGGRLPASHALQGGAVVAEKGES